ncbi:MAG TPA: tRNA (N6-isopentenyl adenosine(37)-C2)-methylthiotransferase MiaB [Desulfobacterales bacterium]|nr:tRNA (N6-isopentenyl adenosine(37)-C2)-methylthiotransferase MiaB [Desulfobacterales bacterium]
MPSKRLYIHTIGCQMNVYDSEHMAMNLATLGYTPAVSSEDADLIIVNTCSVRDKAEQKAFSILGRLEGLKRRRPGLIVGVAGCVAQQEGERIFTRAPHVDIVIGTRAVERLPAHVLKVAAERCRVVDLELTSGLESPDEALPAAGGPGVSRFVTIMRGCDNFCSYCVVPHVRGREVSRPPESIVREITALVAAGKREVTLLGQNVNSYGTKEGLCSFPELLARVSAVDGLLRIRFTTSHPKDLTRDLMESFARIEKLCPHIHLPVQSGSNRLLERMNRKYTREHYLDNVFKLRDTCPEIAITSDMIVGFPGETDADFEETLDLVRNVEFDGLFAFMYSDRPHAPAARLSEKVPAHLKRERLHALLQLQETFTYKKNAALVGSVQEILAEGASRKQAAGSAAERSAVQWTGRTPGNKIVNFHVGGGSANFATASAGTLMRVRIEKALAHSLRGAPETTGPAAGGLKGDACHAA